MIPCRLMAGNSFIADANFSKSQDSVKAGQPLTLSLSFKIDGAIREAFSQRNWERAYNKHDNGFRLTIEIEIKSGRKSILPIKMVRKAALFWTRNPKIPHRVWVSVVKDDTPYYPLTVEEAQSLLFDVNKVIELSGNDLDTGSHKIHAEIRVSWGKHEYTEPDEVHARSNDIDLVRVAA